MNRKVFYTGLQVLTILLINGLIYLFWKVLLDPSNFIWYKISPLKKEWLLEGLNVLFYIHFYVWLVIINGLIAIFYVFKPPVLIKGISILLLLIFYLTIHQLSKKTIINNYTMVFMCQRVPLDIETLPIHMGGKGVLQYLIIHFNQLPEHKQRAVLRAIGELEDLKNIDFLNQYLTHPNHPPTLRAEAYWAIHAMHSSKGQQTLERAHDQIANDSLLKYQIQQLEY